MKNENSRRTLARKHPFLIIAHYYLSSVDIKRYRFQPKPKPQCRLLLPTIEVGQSAPLVYGFYFFFRLARLFRMNNWTAEMSKCQRKKRNIWWIFPVYFSRNRVYNFQFDVRDTHARGAILCSLACTQLSCANVRAPSALRSERLKAFNYNATTSAFNQSSMRCCCRADWAIDHEM